MQLPQMLLHVWLCSTAPCSTCMHCSALPQEAFIHAQQIIPAGYAILTTFPGRTRRYHHSSQETAIAGAGMDTTSSSLAFTLYELSQHPASMRRACGEVRSALGAKPLADWTALDMQQLPFVTACIKENLRLFPPAPFTGRIATEDVVIHGQLLPQGTLTFLDFSSLHLHEEFWPCYQV